MSSWHRVGQKVVRVTPGPWSSAYPTLWERLFRLRSTGPDFGRILTINRVRKDFDGVWLGFAELAGPEVYIATAFRPVYPTIIEQLRNLDAPVPAGERVEEDA